jgi:hypothetical protein
LDQFQKNEEDIQEKTQFFNETNINDTTKNIELLTMDVNKYLGNIKNFVNNTKDVSQDTIQSLKQIPEFLGDLKNKIHDSIINPAFAIYTDPLIKLYKSLQDQYNLYLPIMNNS